MNLNIVIIGLGGIGSNLVRRISRFINYSRDLQANMLLIDGDDYEPKNYERQEFVFIGNKAEIQMQELSRKFKNIDFKASSSYINEKNIDKFINENDIVFICVDNHKSRMIINNYCKTLKNVTLISGGNDLIDGNAQLYVRKEGKDLSPDICAYHPEIANPNDKLPEEMSCDELSSVEPQLYFTNTMVSIYMCCLFFNAVIHNRYEKSEVYFDIENMKADSKIRTVKK